MKKFKVCFMVMLLLVGVRQAYASIVITPDGAGSANGFQNIATGGFNSQPVSIPVAGTTTDAFGTDFTLYTVAGRGIYFDFGANWNQVTIEEVWLGLKQFGPDPAGTPVSYWSSGNTVASAELDGVAAPNFLWDWTSATSDKSWQRVWSGTETVKNRYYVEVYDGTQTWTNRSQELVFTGSVIPEPSSVAMILFGLVVCGRILRLKHRRS